MNSNNVLYRNSFSHIYVEERVRNLPVTIQILSRFPHATVIPVRHYMDVFSPHKQPFVLQEQSQ